MKGYKHIVLLLSLAIYAWFIGCYVFVLLGLSVIVMMTYRLPQNMNILIPACFLVLGFVLMKYAFPQSYVSLPIGYSVFSFSCISFLVDYKKSKHKCRVKGVDLLCYLFFFPKMLCGPLVKFAPFQKQIESPAFPDKIATYQIFKILVFASFCKFCIADSISWIVSADNLGVNAWIASVIFAIQLYFDFYAYSLFAIGFASLLGIQLPCSFKSPYRADSLKDFWHRWNITVSAWLKEYIYIPLGGNRHRNSYRKSFNVITTFFVSGIWHGASLPFILWGILHGILYNMERIINNVIRNRISRLLYRFLILVAIMLLWQFFRLNTSQELVTFFSSLLHYAPMDVTILLYMIVSSCVLLLIDSKQVKSLIFSTTSDRIFIYKEVALLSGLLFTTILFHSNSQINFFYFKF